MPLPIIFDTMGGIIKEFLVNELLETNGESEKYGLILSPKDAEEIMEKRDNTLQNYGRVELSMDVPGRLVKSFCSSPFIRQEEYLSTINELIEIFYYLKNEVEDKIGDDELINILNNFFNNSCGGSIELLKGRELESLIRDIRFSITDDGLMSEEG